MNRAEELLAARAEGLTLVQWPAKRAGLSGRSGALPPDDSDAGRLEKLEQL